MKRVLIVHPGPLGNHTATYQFCFHLSSTFDVTYCGMDEGHGYKDLTDIQVFHIPFLKSGINRKIEFFKLVNILHKENKYDFILVNYFPLCSLIRLLTRTCCAVEIRTSYIFSSKLRRLIYNTFLIGEVRIFNNATVLSASLKKYLWLPQKTEIVALGSPEVDFVKPPIRNEMRLLYVGTFRQRKITDTIFAYKKFLEKIDLSFETSYDIIGFGSKDDELEIISLIAEKGLENRVKFHGLVRYPELSKFFEKCNVGISYIPMEKYFQNQPPTKTYEYLLNGMPVIATNINEHMLIINSSNGVLCNDDIDSLYQAMIELYARLPNYVPADIQLESQKYSWKNIVNDQLTPFINKSIDRNVNGSRS